MLVEPLARTIQRLGPVADDAELLRAFADGRCDDAFAGLVRRHGPMVLGVCRRTLGHCHDAEDAFQAVFLVLARKARSIRGDGVGRWLYGVAVRVARKARRRRDRHPHSALNVEPLTNAPMVSDEGPVIDAMIAQLSTRHRDALILCDVQGWSRADAARHLGIAEGTLSSRLSRARQRVRARLVRRGIVPALLLAASPVPATLIDRTLTHTASTLGRELAAGVIHAMTAAKFAKLFTLAACIAVVGGVGYLAAPGSAADPKKPPAQDAKTKEPPKAAALSDADRIKGTWVVESHRRNGPELDIVERSFKGEAWTFDGESTQIPFFGKKKFAYRLDPGWDLKRIDIDLHDHMRGGKLTTVQVPCIYRFEGDKLHLVFGVVELDERPASFDHQIQGPPFTHFILKRGESRDANAEEMKALQGEWRSVAGITPKHGREEWTGASLKIEDNRFRLVVVEPDGVLSGTFSVDVGHTPRHIDLIMTAGVDYSHVGKVVKSIFTRDGDTLQLMLGDSDTPRPTKFDGKSSTAMIFERAKPKKDVMPKAEKPVAARSSSRVRELQHARVKALTEQIEGQMHRVQIGKEPLSSLTESVRELAEAEHELAVTPADHLAAAEKLLRVLNQIEEQLSQLQQAGLQHPSAVAQARAARLKAEIEVEKLKSK